MNDSIVSVQLTPNEISMITNSLSYELWAVTNKNLDSSYKKELKKLYERLSTLEDEI
jgi:hypothetical protein